MSTLQNTLVAAPFEKQEHVVTNRTGATLPKGSLVALDLTGSDADVKSITAFDPTTDRDTAHPFGNVIKCATAHLKGWVFGVAMTDIVNDAKGKIVTRGFVELLMVPSGTTAVAAGDGLTCVNAKTYATKAGDGNARVGVALESNDATSTTKWVLFDGWALSSGVAA